MGKTRKLSLLPLFVVVGLTFLILLPAQTGGVTLSGKVLDKETGNPLTGVKVSLGKSTVLTGMDGNYRIFCKSGRYTLNVSMEGYEVYTDLMNINKNQDFDIALTPIKGYVPQSPLPNSKLIPTIKVTVNPPLLYTRKNKFETVVRAFVTKKDGTPVVGANVYFESYGDVPGSFNSTSATTNIRGVATVSWNCRSAGQKINEGHWPRMTWRVNLIASYKMGHLVVKKEIVLYIQPEACHHSC